MIKLINTPEEFKENYYYKSPPNPEPCPTLDEYPKNYPCILHQYTDGGGIGGSFVVHNIVYIPEGLDSKSFFEGYKANIINENY